MMWYTRSSRARWAEVRSTRVRLNLLGVSIMIRALEASRLVENHNKVHVLRDEMDARNWSGNGRSLQQDFLDDLYTDDMNPEARAECTRSDLSWLHCKQSMGWQNACTLHWGLFRLKSEQSDTSGLPQRKVTLTLVCKTTGWVALGWASTPWQMEGGLAVVGAMKEGYSPVGPSWYHLNSKDVEGMIPAPEQDSSLQGGELSQFNGLTMLQFDRPVVGVDAGGEGAEAVAPPSPGESAALHTMREGWQDMIWAMGEDDNDVLSETRGGCRRRGAVRVDFQLAAAEVQELRTEAGVKRGRMYVVHGAAMILAYGFLFPLGVIVARYVRMYEKQYRRLHVCLQIAGALVALGAFVVATTSFHQPGRPGHAHGKLGYVVLGLTFTQMLLGTLHPRRGVQKKPLESDDAVELATTQPAWFWYWDIFHSLFGWLLLALGVANILVGLFHLGATEDGGGTPHSAILAYGLWVAAMCVIMTMLEWHQWNQLYKITLEAMRATNTRTKSMRDIRNLVRGMSNMSDYEGKNAYEAISQDFQVQMKKGRRFQTAANSRTLKRRTMEAKAVLNEYYRNPDSQDSATELSTVERTCSEPNPLDALPKAKSVGKDGFKATEIPLHDDEVVRNSSPATKLRLLVQRQNQMKSYAIDSLLKSSKDAMVRNPMFPAPTPALSPITSMGEASPNGDIPNPLFSKPLCNQLSGMSNASHRDPMHRNNTVAVSGDEFQTRRADKGKHEGAAVANEANDLSAVVAAAAAATAAAGGRTDDGPGSTAPAFTRWSAEVVDQSDENGVWRPPEDPDWISLRWKRRTSM
mmetsp:Transcript_38009/g.72882  ORF Transcript_38009/g.72882 Transcript_38009/m.72882 type:complete len:805 (+) Transcript_38009:372-2786(+)